MIDMQNFRSLLTHLGFQAGSSTTNDVMRKSFGQTNFELAVDFAHQKIIYPTDDGLKVHAAQTCNFSAAENAVVFECIHRLFEKGYQPQHLELEPPWRLGHGGKSGRADILVRNQLGAALLIIECKTAGAEFTKAWKDTLTDGAQLFSYVEQEKATHFVCLYASEFDAKAQIIALHQKIISVKDNPKILEDYPKALSFSAANNNKERFKVWTETYTQECTETGIFEANIEPYQIGKNKYTLADDTKPLSSSDIKGAYHRFRTILRKHNVSRRENAFEVLVNLFLCKIVDELENPGDLKFYWKGIAYDNYFDLVDRLQSLYKVGMERFLGQDIVYISNDEIDKAFWAIKQKRNATKARIKEIFRELKFYKGLDFELIKVFNKAYFDKNAKILLEIIQMWQGLRLTSSGQNQFLGDMFEYFLDNGIKQSEGQFFTPVPICKFIVSSLPLEQIITQHSDPLHAIDYACGSGHFLTEYAQSLPALLQKHKNLGDPSSYFARIVGVEKEDRLAKVAKVSAFMYGFKDIQVIDADALVPHADVKDQSFQLLVANPPFAVEDFLLTVPEENRERFELLKTVSDLGNRNVQCFFLERAQQLLAPGGVAGIIVPSSILSNTDAMHIATRALLLSYFDFVAIAELGGQTFGKTNTNTVVLFLRRKVQRPEPAEHYANRTLDYFENWLEEAKSGGGAYQDLDVVRQYCQHTGQDFDAYASLLLGRPNDALLQSELFKAYKQAFDALTEIRKLKENKAFKLKTQQVQAAELTQRFTNHCREHEKPKLTHFMLAHNNPTPVLLVKPPADGKLQKQFLGYEWSGAKGSEGIQYSHGSAVQDIQTPLFDPLDRDNEAKISTLIRQNFEGRPLVIPEGLQPFASQAKLVDLLEFGRIEFNGLISLNVVVKSLVLVSKWLQKNLHEVTIINPSKTELKNISNELMVSFVEMASVSDQGFIEKEKSRQISELKKGGFTYFAENDVLIAKITPCMENGKAALAKNLTNGIGFGSTEFHVFRANSEQLLSGYLFLFLNRQEIRQAAENNMTGSSGHRRVPESFYIDLKIPVPPLDIQQQIVAECEAVDKSVELARGEIATAQQNVNTAYEQAMQTATQEFKLSNADLFEVSIGRRVLKSEITDDASRTPVYSANVLQPFGYIQKSLLKDFSGASVLWGIDGDWMVNLIPENTPFYPTDHCGVIRIKAGAKVHPRYLAMALDLEGQRVRFSRSNRAKTDAIKGLKLRVPSWKAQENLAKIADLAQQTSATAQATIAAAPALKQAILQKYL